MSKSNERWMTKNPEITHDLVYVLNVFQKGYLWWKKPAYETKLADFIVGELQWDGSFKKSQPMEVLYKGDKITRNNILNYIDNKLETLGILLKDIQPCCFRMDVNSKWAGEEMDKAIDHFVTNTIKYK